MHASGLIPWLDPETIIAAAGPWALLVVCGIIFAETGLLLGFLLPGDTLLIIAGLLTNTSRVFGMDVWLVALLIGVSAFLGGELGYYIGVKSGPALFERKQTGVLSSTNVARVNVFFERFGPPAVVAARFVPVVRTVLPVAAGVARMPWSRYSLYNAVGALVWAFALTLLGYAVGAIPPVADLVTRYIDVILVGVVVITAAITGGRYLRERRRSRRDAVSDDRDRV